MLESRSAEDKRFDPAAKAAVTVTLPSPGRLALALALIVAVFFAALAIGRSNRPRAPRVRAAQPQPIATTAPSATITLPPGAPPVPALKELKPRVPVLRAARSPSVI
jgi:hypothetical protein